MKGLLFSLLFFIPAAAFAAGAGFADQSVFLSNDAPSEGSTVIIYANISNSAAEHFEGKVVFSDNDAKIGSVAVSLASGEARLVSVSWKAVAGDHTLSAELQDQSGATVKIIETKKTSVSVAARSPEAAVAKEPTTIESSDEIQKDIAKISPAAANFVEPALEKIDDARGSAAEIIDSQIQTTKPKLPGVVPQGSSKNKPDGLMGWLMAMLYTLWFYVLTVAHYVIASAFFFYPLLVIVFLWLMWKLYRKLSGPRY